MPDRRSSPSGTQPAAPPITADIYAAAWLRKQQNQAGGEEPGDAEAQPDAPPPPPDQNSDRDLDRNQPSLPDPLTPQASNRVPLTTDSGFAALLGTISSATQPFSIKKGPFARRR
jgi:hypothetical protein